MDGSNIVELVSKKEQTGLDINDLLESAKEGNLTELIIIGYDKEDTMRYYNSGMTLAETLWLIENLKKFILSDEG